MHSWVSYIFIVYRHILHYSAGSYFKKKITAIQLLKNKIKENLKFKFININDIKMLNVHSTSQFIFLIDNIYIKKLDTLALYPIRLLYYRDGKPFSDQQIYAQY